MQYVPVLDYLAAFVKPEDVYSRPIARRLQFLETMQDNETAFRDDALEMNALFQIQAFICPNTFETILNTFKTKAAYDTKPTFQCPEKGRL